MNNGLIEREKVISTLRRVFEKYNIGFENGQGGFADEVSKAIKAIPTTYDLDKVVERLEEMREEMLTDTAYDNDTVNHYLGYADLMIEAVKSGGIG